MPSPSLWLSANGCAVKLVPVLLARRSDFLKRVPKTAALKKRGPATEKSGGLGDHERLWPLERPRPDTSTGTACVLWKLLSHGSRGRSSRQCLSSGAGEAWHGGGLPSEVRVRPKARSLPQQADPGNEPIIRLPKLPTFLLPVRWQWDGLCARIKPAGKGDKSKSCRAGLPRRRCHAGQELDSSPLVVGPGPR